jgi:hypothetical protein
VRALGTDHPGWAIGKRPHHSRTGRRVTRNRPLPAGRAVATCRNGDHYPLDGSSGERRGAGLPRRLPSTTPAVVLRLSPEWLIPARTTPAVQRRQMPKGATRLTVGRGFDPRTSKSGGTAAGLTSADPPDAAIARLIGAGGLRLFQHAAPRICVWARHRTGGKVRRRAHTNEIVRPRPLVTTRTGRACKPNVCGDLRCPHWRATHIHVAPSGRPEACSGRRFVGSCATPRSWPNRSRRRVLCRWPVRESAHQQPRSKENRYNSERCRSAAPYAS